MQISDELLKLVSDLEIAVFNGAPRPAIVGSFGRLRAALSALSLPVQPVAWTPYQIMLIIHYHVSGAPFYLSQAPIWRATVDDLVAQGILAMREELFCYQTTAKGDALVKSWQSTTPPAPPTKGPEDDLIAAREAAAQWRDARSEHGHAKCLRAGTFDQLPEVQSALLALRSRPASALPVVGEDGAK